MVAEACRGTLIHKAHPRLHVNDARDEILAKCVSSGRGWMHQPHRIRLQISGARQCTPRRVHDASGHGHRSQGGSPLQCELRWHWFGLPARYVSALMHVRKRSCAGQMAWSMCIPARLISHRIPLRWQGCSHPVPRAMVTAKSPKGQSDMCAPYATAVLLKGDSLGQHVCDTCDAILAFRPDVAAPGSGAAVAVLGF